jgi:hypothetical protein
VSDTVVQLTPLIGETLYCLGFSESIRLRCYDIRCGARSRIEAFNVFHDLYDWVLDYARWVDVGRPFDARAPPLDRSRDSDTLGRWDSDCSQEHATKGPVITFGPKRRNFKLRALLEIGL